MTSLIRRLAAALTLAATPVVVDAATLDGNDWVGAITGHCRFQCNGDVGAEDFQLLTNATVESFTFDTWYLTSSDDTGTTVDWSIRTDALSLPGTILSSGTATPTMTNLGPAIPSFDRVSFFVDIPDLALGPGDYWLTLALTVPNSTFAFYWASTTDGNLLSAESTTGGATWTTPYGGGAAAPWVFSIEGTTGPAAVPLPAPALLLIGALGAFSVARRVRKAR